MSINEEATQPKKDSKVRTSITIDPEVLDAVRRVCAEGARSVSSYIEEALKQKMGTP